MKEVKMKLTKEDRNKLWMLFVKELKNEIKKSEVFKS